MVARLVYFFHGTRQFVDAVEDDGELFGVIIAVSRR